MSQKIVWFLFGVMFMSLLIIVIHILQPASAQTSATVSLPAAPVSVSGDKNPFSAWVAQKGNIYYYRWDGKNRLVRLGEAQIGR